MMRYEISTEPGDGRKRPGRVYAFSCNEARTLFRELYLALCAAPPE